MLHFSKQCCATDNTGVYLNIEYILATLITNISEGRNPPPPAPLPF